MSRTRSILAIAIVALGWIAAIPSFAQEPPAPWRDDALFKRLAAKLDAVPAIDNHTHLGGRTVFDPDLDRFSPLLLRSTNPWLPSILKSRFGVTFAGDWKAAIAELDKARDTMIGRLTPSGYWRDHLDYTRTDIALVNTQVREAYGWSAPPALGAAGEHLPVSAPGAAPDRAEPFSQARHQQPAERAASSPEGPGPAGAAC